MSFRNLFLCMALSMLSACYFPEASLSESEERLIKQSIIHDVSEVQPAVKVNAIMGDQARLIGFDLSHNTIRPNEKVKITYYIESLTDEAEDLEIFVHLQGNRAKMWQNLDHTPIRGLFPLRMLKKGQVLKDIQEFRVKSSYPSGKAKLFWGLFTQKGRIKIKNRDEVPHDGKERVELTSITILPPRPPAVVQAYAVQKGETLKIDGLLNEESWREAEWTKYWRDPLGRRSHANPKNNSIPQTRAKFLWSFDALYIAIESRDRNIWAKLTERDSNTWEEEVVEVFIDADGDQRNYLELQVTPANVVFDAKFAYRRSDLNQARAWDMKGWETAVSVEGTLNDSTDQDQRYIVEMKIPINEVPGAPSILSAESTPWRINLFRFDWDDAPKGHQRAAALSPPYVGDFHALEAFATLKFRKPSTSENLQQPGTEQTETGSLPLNQPSSPSSLTPVAKPAAP